MNWLHHIWFVYFYPSLQGNGPEDIVRTTIAIVLAVIIVPRIRHFFERHYKSMHAKMDHIIKHHPDIPPFESKEHK